MGSGPSGNWGGSRPGSGRPKGAGQELAEMVRQAFKDAMEMSAEAGRPLNQLLLKEMRKNPTRFTEAMGKFLPKDINIREERSVLDELSDDELAQLVKEARAAHRAGEGTVTPTRKRRVVR